MQITLLRIAHSGISLKTHDIYKSGKNLAVSVLDRL